MKIQRSDQSASVQNEPIVSGRENGNDSVEVNKGSTPKGDRFVSSDKGNDWISSSLCSDVNEANKKDDSSSDQKQLWDVRHSPGS
ncbi:hypothetical protein L0244_07395 [bacterium]|nr:hypothetical protein [bacterium]